MGNWKDAYEAQMDLWKWSRTQDGLNQMFNTVNVEQIPDQSQPLFLSLVRIEENKLEGADPIYVAEEFCDLCDHTQWGFKPEPILASDFITPQGFLFYEKPIQIPTKDPAWDEHLAGFSWTPLMFDRKNVNVDWPVTKSKSLFPEDAEVIAGGVALTLYAAVPEERRHHQYTDGSPLILPSIVPMHLTPWYFDMTFEGNEVDINGNETAVIVWWRLVQVTLRLMQQKLAARQGTQADRASRRRGQRIGFAPRETVVVRLRRHKAAPTENEREVHWTHRWYSKGYWRNTWYPSLGTHRQQYVSGSVKGPDGLPLILKGRAYQWEE